MADEETLKTRIDELEKKKGELIERIKQLNRRIRYKKYEQKALEPFLEQTKDVQIAPLRKQKRALDFRISTAAYTPKMEKELIKQLKKVDEELDKVKEVERARRKIKYVEQDITDGETEIVKIETELKVIRDELKKLYDEMKTFRVAARKQAQAAARAEDELVALGDLAILEKEGE
ncbi:MAG: hypothetical protein AB1324_06960 [Candidatus Micrarchaeota archaeon]